MKKTLVLLLALALVAVLALMALAEEEPVCAPVAEAVAELGEIDLAAAEDAPEAPDAAAEANVASAAPTEDAPKAAVPSKLTLGLKETYKLSVRKAKGYKSSDKTVAAVSDTGVITARKVGTAKITVTDSKGKKTTVKVTVKKAPKALALNKTEKLLAPGGTLKLKVTLPDGTASKQITWKSSKPKVASVSDAGVVTALADGEAVITVSAFNGVQATCAVTVDSANDLVRKYVKAAGLTNRKLEKLTGETLEALNEKGARYFTDLELVTGSVRWKMTDDKWQSVTVLGYKGTPKTLTLKATYGDGLPIAQINEGAFENNAKLQKLVVEEGVTGLVSYAFRNCPKLRDITLPDSLKKIGFHTFRDCGTAKKTPFTLVLPDHLVEDVGGLWDCNAVLVCGKGTETALALSKEGFEITFPGEEDFRYRYMELTGEDSWQAQEDGVWGTQLALLRYVGEGGAVKIPEGAVYICDGAFAGNTAITSVTIPEGVVRLCYDVFNGCTGIKKVKFPSTLKSIQNKAFYGVTKAKYFDLPDHLTGITGNGGGAHSFEGCTAILRVTKDSDSAWLLGGERNYDVTFPGEEDFRYRYIEFAREGGWEAEEDGVWGKKLAVVGYAGKGGAVEIPKGPVYIYHSAFAGKTKITSVVIPKGVVRICYDAFNGCKNITSVKFPSTLKSIMNKAFYGVKKVKYFDLPNNLTGITGDGGGAHSFEGCSAALRVKRGCATAKLLSAERNYDITFPGEEDFRYRYEKVNVNGKTVYRLYLWDYVGTATEVVIPEVYGVGRIPAGGSDPWHPAFYNNKKITKVVIPEGAVVVEDSAFSGCTMLTDITLPSTLKVLKNHAFERTGTAAGKRFIVVLPKGLEEITAGTGAGWDSFNESGATIVALNSTIRKALYEGWYVYYNSLKDARNRRNLRYKPNDDPNFKYRGCR